MVHISDRSQIFFLFSIFVNASYIIGLLFRLKLNKLMMAKIIAIIVCVIVASVVVHCQFIVKQSDVSEVNDTPIIGVLAQEISYHLNSKWPDEFKSYIAASYVKFVEGGGGRVVPIW